MTNPPSTSLKRVIRQRPLTGREPELIALDNLRADVRKRLHLETLDTRGRDSLDFHDISVEGIRDVISMAFRAGKTVGAEGFARTKPRRKSNKRFRLLHVEGGVDPSILGKPCKDFESLLKIARKFFNSDDFTEGKDALFYIVTSGNSVWVSPFDSSDIEDED